MIVAGKYEFVELVHLVENSNPKSVENVRKILDDHFATVEFSLLQHEWKTVLIEKQKNALCEKMFNDYQQHKKRKKTLS